MRPFAKVSPQLWRSKRFRSLKDDAAKLLYCYLLTSEHHTSAGVFRIPDAYAAEDLQWKPNDVRNARDCLVEAGMIVFDPATNEYFIQRWFKHNPATNKNHRTGLERILSELESEVVFDAALADYKEYDPSIALESGRLPRPRPVHRPEFNETR